MKSTLRLVFCIVFLTGCLPGAEAQTISTVAGNGVQAYSGNGMQATQASLNIPAALAIDYMGNLYVSDQENYLVRKINRSNNIITNIAGNHILGYGGDGMAATAAELDQDWGIATDGSGNIYIADQGSHRVRKVNVSGIITTIAGTGVDSCGGEGIPAVSAGIRKPIGLATDAGGNLYISDQACYCVRKINAAGIISTVAGNGSYGNTGDGGPATLASFSVLYGLATDGAGNLYICDAGSNCIRKVSPDGHISTVAGTGAAGYNGDNQPATISYLNYPTSVTVDIAGNIYIADCNNHRIRKVNSGGIITTIGGTGSPGFFGDGAAAVLAKLNFPLYVVMDSFDNLYISDQLNERIRKISRDLIFSCGHNKGITVCQDVSSPIDSILSIRDLNVGLTDSWSLTSAPVNGTTSISYTTMSDGGVLVPSGLFYTPNPGFTGSDSFKVRVTNGLDSNFITIFVTVDTMLSYAGVINGPSRVCVGAEITLTDNVGAGTWSITNLNALVYNGTVWGELPGTDSVWYTIRNNCGSVSVSKLITIDSLPTAGTITGPADICLGTPSTYTDNLPGGIWSVGPARAAITASGTVTATRAGIDTVWYSVTDLFCTGQSPFAVKIDSLPNARLLPSDTAVCAGAVFSIADTPAGGVWTVTNANATISQGVFTALSTGVDTVNYFVSNACGTAPSQVHVKINPLPAQPDIIENGSTISVPPGYFAYQWLLNGTPIPGSVSDTYLVAATGQYSVYVKNEFGCSVISPSLFVSGCEPADIVIYPNPTVGPIYLKWCKTVTAKVICDDGKIYESAKGVNWLDLGYLPNADYLLVLYDSNGNKILTKRVTKIAR